MAPTLHPCPDCGAPVRRERCKPCAIRAATVASLRAAGRAPGPRDPAARALERAQDAHDDGDEDGARAALKVYARIVLAARGLMEVR